MAKIHKEEIIRFNMDLGWKKLYQLMKTESLIDVTILLIGYIIYTVFNRPKKWKF